MEIIKWIENIDKVTIINLLIATMIIIFFYLLSTPVSYILVKIFNIKKGKKKIKQNAFYIPLISFFKISGIYIGLIFLKPTLHLSKEIMDMITRGYKLLIILATATGLSQSLTKNSRLVKHVREKSDKDIDDVTVKYSLRILKIVIYVVAAFLIAADFGYDLSALITGLGLGSVVVTLAAQDTIKNLFGGLMIFLDKPFKAGDYIKCGAYEGTVEDITFRSTRIRTLENSIAQIPNAEISSVTLTNISQMEKRRYELNLGIVLDTDLYKIHELKQDILRYMDSNPNVLPDTANVYFSEIKSNEFNIKIFCYLNVVDYIEFLGEKEIINYEIVKLVNKHKIGLAYDTKTIEIKHT